MTRFHKLTMTMLCLLAPVAAYAQNSGSAEPLPLSRAIDEALAQNASLRAAKAGSDAAGADADAARASLFPRISFTESWQRGDQPVFVFSTLLASRRFAASNFAIEQLNHPDPLGYFHATAGVEQLLFDGGARRAGIDTAKAQQQLADLSTREAALALVFEVSDTYGRLLASQAARAAAAAALDAGREDLARAERRRDAGVVTESDVLALRVHVAGLEQRVIQADGDAAVLRAQINRLTGAPVDHEFAAVEPAAAPDTSQPSLAQLLTDAESNRPELQRANVTRQIAENTRHAARSGLVPQVAAQAAFDVSGTHFQDRAGSWLVGGEVRWSLSTGGAERAQMKAAAAGAARASAEAEDARARVQVEVVTALRQWQSARARQAVGRAAVAEARESQRIIRDRYEAGLAPVNDLLRAATAVLDADAQRVSALVDEITGQAHLNRAVGHLP